MALSSNAGRVWAPGDQPAATAHDERETPEQKATPRRDLWRAVRALENLVRVSSHRRDQGRFELALEEGAAALAALPKLAR